MPRTIVTAPAEEPVRVSELKDHLRIDITADDNYLAGLIIAARKYVETSVLSSALITQTWDYIIDDFPGSGIIELPMPPLQSVTSLNYTDEDDNETTFNSSNYRVDTDSFPGRIVLKSDQSWPTVTLKEFGGVVVRFVAGYGTAVDVPQPIKQAIKFIVGDMYENRENTLVAQGVTVARLPFRAETFLADYRHKEF